MTKIVKFQEDKRALDSVFLGGSVKTIIRVKRSSGVILEPCFKTSVKSF